VRAEVVFLAGHGMGTKYRAQFLSDQILLRLGVAAPVQPEASQELAQSVIWRGRIDPVVGWGGRHLPETVQKTLTPLDRGMRAWGVSILDFAPTLSTLLGVELSDASSPS
jgi:hypothetical protein